MAEDTYINPGSAAVDAISRFMLERERQKDRELARKHQSEVEKRQLDKDEADAKYRQQQIDNQQKVFEANQQDKGYQRTEKRLNDMVPGDVPDPELISDAQKYGLSHRLSTTSTPDYSLNPAPVPNADGTPAAPVDPSLLNQGPVPSTMTSTNIGTPQQRQVVKRETYLDTLMNDPELDPASKKALEYQRATGQAPPAGIFKLAGTADTQPLFRIDARGDRVEQFVNGKWTPFTGEPPKNAKWFEVQHAPAGPQSAQGIETAVSPEDSKMIDMYAKQVATGKGWPPLGNGAPALALRKQIGRRAADYDATTDSFASSNSAPDIGGASADFKANKDAVVKLTGLQAGVDAFSGAAERNSKSLDAILDKLPDTGNTWLNMPYRAVLASGNNEALKQFQVYRESLNNEYTRILNSANMAGSMTNAMKEDMATIMNNNSTVSQIRSALAALKTEAKNRHDSYDSEIKQLRGKMTTGGGSAKDTDATALPPGVTVRRKKQ